jgi:hypothetical protein
MPALYATPMTSHQFEVVELANKALRLVFLYVIDPKESDCPCGNQQVLIIFSDAMVPYTVYITIQDYRLSQG